MPEPGNDTRPRRAGRAGYALWRQASTLPGGWSTEARATYHRCNNCAESLPGRLLPAAHGRRPRLRSAMSLRTHPSARAQPTGGGHASTRWVFRRHPPFQMTPLAITG